MKLIFPIYFLQASWLLSACQPDLAPAPIRSLTAIPDPASATPKLPLVSTTATPVAAAATPTFTDIPTQDAQLTAHYASGQAHTSIEQQDATSGRALLFPDCEIVYSPTALDFNSNSYLADTSGSLKEYREYLRSTGWTSAADIIQRVALESSINPRLQLALIEYQTSSVRGVLDPDFQMDYLLGREDYHHKGLYGQLSWAASQLSAGSWVVAVADGLVVRSEFGAVVQDISGDGIEQTGWAILYMHILSDGRVAPGTYLQAGDPVGHPSCEGGRANGTHLHIARKYNGEWIAAGGPIPFVLSGWTAYNGLYPYEGSLRRGKRTVEANPHGISISHISRTDANL